MEGISAAPADIVDEILASKIIITYPNGKTVEFGQELTPTDVQDEPQVSWEADRSGRTHQTRSKISRREALVGGEHLGL
jgi:hypothetical protein